MQEHNPSYYGQSHWIGDNGMTDAPGAHIDRNSTDYLQPQRTLRPDPLPRSQPFPAPTVDHIAYRLDRLVTAFSRMLGPTLLIGAMAVTGWAIHGWL